MLNNHAFSYNISVPVHIILRSGGSITTIMAGYVVGKRYTRTQIFSVILLTVGVIIAAWYDAKGKVCTKTTFGHTFKLTFRTRARMQMQKASLTSAWD